MNQTNTTEPDIILANTVTGFSNFIKEIRPDLLKHAVIKDRFLREAKVAASLSHPSILPIYSITATENTIFYTMPYIEGETLRQILRSPEKTNISFLMRIFLHICSATAYAHSKGVLHRDIKPENVIVGKFGEVFVLDWGLADFLGDKIVHTAPDLTSPGKIVGTLLYMAPELALGVIRLC